MAVAFDKFAGVALAAASFFGGNRRIQAAVDAIPSVDDLNKLAKASGGSPGRQMPNSGDLIVTLSKDGHDYFGALFRKNAGGRPDDFVAEVKRLSPTTQVTLSKVESPL